MSKEERQRIYEYAMDRKNREIEELKQKILDEEAKYAKHSAMVITAEILLFFLGVFVGVILMKAYGWRML